MIGTIARPATGSAHHQPNSQLSPRPPRRMAESTAQRSVWRESACKAPELRPAATLRFARARIGMTISDTAASTMPTRLSSGASRSHSVLADSQPT